MGETYTIGELPWNSQSSPSKFLALRALQRNVQGTVQKLYADNDLEALRGFVKRHIELLDRVTARFSGKRAMDVVGECLQVTPSKLPDAIVKHLGNSPYNQCSSDSNRSYAGLFRVLAYGSHVRNYSYEEWSDIPSLDILFLSHDLYSTLYMALIDALIGLHHWETGVSMLAELCVVLHLIRVDLLLVVSNLGNTTVVNAPLSKLKEGAINQALLGRGIYLRETKDVNDNHGIIVHVLEYSLKELHLETWSRAVYLWLQDSSFHNVMETLSELPLPFRQEMVSRFKLTFVNVGLETYGKTALIKKQGRHRQVSRHPNRIVHAKVSVCGTLKCLKPYKDVCAYLLASPGTRRRYAFEGLLMMATISRDINHNSYVMLCLIVYTAARVIVSYYPFSRHLRKSPGHAYHLEGGHKRKSGPIDHDNMILQYVSFHQMVNQRVSCPFSSVKDIWVKHKGLWAHIDMKPASVIKGVSNYLSYRLHSLEHLIMMEFKYSSVSDTTFIESGSSLTQRKTRPEKKNRIWMNIANVHERCYSGSRRPRNCLVCVKNPSGTDGTVYLRVCFKPLLPAVLCRRRLERYMKNDRISCMFNLHDISKTRQFKSQSVAPTFEDDVIIALVAFCFTLDRPYMILHFKQALEFLNYTDTLKKKHRKFIRKILTCLPVRNTEETRKIQSFQRFIKSVFHSKIKGVYDAAVNDGKIYDKHGDASGWLSRSYSEPLALQTYGHASYGYKTPTHIDDDEFAFHFGSEKKDGHIRSKFTGVMNKAKGVLKSATSLLKSSYATVQQTCKTNMISAGKCKVIGEYPYILNDGCDELPEATDSPLTPICKHMATKPSLKDCRICLNKEPFKLVDRMSMIIDWIAHHIFTGRLKHHPMYTSHWQFKGGMAQREYAEVFEADHRPLVNTKETEQASDSSATSSWESKRPTETIFPQVAHLSTQKGKQIDHPSDPLGLLNEILEVTILTSLATFFDEHQYNHLLLRLCILQALQGRWNLSLAIMKQLKGKNSGYITPIGLEHLPDYRASNLTYLEHCFTTLLSGKLLVELVHDPETAIEVISKSYNENQGSKLSAVPLSFQEHPAEEKTDLGTFSDDHLCLDDLITAKKHLTAGASYLKLNRLQVDCNSLPITHLESSILRIDHPGLDSIKCIEFEDNTDKRKHHPYHCTLITKHRGFVQDPLMMAANCIMKSLSMDPNSYKAWVYMANCALRSHDLYFARECCENSIACYDACLSAWLTMSVVVSTRSRSCSPLPVSEASWQGYLIHKKNTQDGDSEGLVISSVPVPFDPILPIGDGVETDLDFHMNRAVGGDLSECLNYLVTATSLSNIFPAAGILQLCSRISEKCVYTFPWETSYACNVQMDQREIFYILRSSIYCHTKDTTHNANRTSGFLDVDQMYMVIKNIVSSAVSEKIFISSLAFIKHLIGLFAPELTARITTHWDCVDNYTPYDGMIHRSCKEELYGWITYLEVLSQCGQATMAYFLLPLMETYVKACEQPEPEMNHVSVFRTVVENGQCDAYRSAEARRHFNNSVLLATDIVAEASFIHWYIRCFLTKDSGLQSLLDGIQETRTRCVSRKLELLECRLLAAMGHHNECVLLCERLLRKGFVCDPSTDYLLEYQTMKVYSLVLSKIGELDQAIAVDLFAEQCYISTPVLKCDLCLLDPL